ncbi:MAG: DUF1643 domain-containing protein [Planctomycetota bacterium]
MKVQPGVEAGAEISECGRYRYALWRDWDWQGYANRVAFVGLNPSTADADQDDRTIRKCMKFARKWGYGGILMLNAYAFRATKPADMFAADDPIGPANDEALSYRANQAGLVIACWGAHCDPEREARVYELLSRRASRVECLSVTKAGRPGHPLYIRGDTKPVPFVPRALEGEKR